MQPGTVVAQARPSSAHTGAAAASDRRAAPGRAATGWEARLELVFDRDRGATRIARRRHYGPLLVQSAFHPEGPTCHVYVLHPPGGVAQGDRLDIDIEAGAHSAALLTTPAAGKFHRCVAGGSRQQVTVRLAPHAALEWLPQENLLFDHARTTLGLRVDLSASSRFIGWDVTGFGRPGCREDFSHGSLRADLEIHREGVPVLIERLHLAPGERTARAPWGLHGRTATGTLLATPADADLRDRARAAIADADDAGVTLVDGLLVCRCLAHETRAIRAAFEAIWAAVRMPVLGRPACAPRIWAT
jgi:urease accessory protein